jgi:hypothetical protein
MGEKRNAYREGNRPLGKPRHGWIILKWILEKMG